jgi:hydroxyacylglutathione hydrolase
LSDRVDEVPSDRPVVVHCLGGTRSAIAASVLQAHGRQHVSNFSGGYSAWRAAGLEAETEGEGNSEGRQG